MLRDCLDCYSVAVSKRQQSEGSFTLDSQALHLVQLCACCLVTHQRAHEREACRSRREPGEKVLFTRGVEFRVEGCTRFYPV